MFENPGGPRPPCPPSLPTPMIIVTAVIVFLAVVAFNDSIECDRSFKQVLKALDSFKQYHHNLYRM